ncbi:AtzH-like domain-containing protein [Streptomyces cavernae]|uniref:AtzH-like domain-containing protein n=1 Tax=Streptomyces cavernae TaxID=2259034 RepID=UPI001EE3DEA2|nr:AtzH-like domain-containing protein [Streptomyces cavernae]
MEPTQPMEPTQRMEPTPRTESTPRTELDLPRTIAEVTAAFSGYEEALVSDDREAITRYFWDSPDTVRFGIADRQTGAGEIRRWRWQQPPLPPGRKLFDTRISTFGTDFATVTTLFVYPGSTLVGRQTQAWVRFPVGWKIVSAHVSEIPGTPDASTGSH